MITPAFKKVFKGFISKIREKILAHQITSCMDKFFTKYQRDTQKGYSAQYCPSAMLGKWKKAVHKGKVFGALLADLS